MSALYSSPLSSEEHQQLHILSSLRTVIYLDENCTWGIRYSNSVFPTGLDRKSVV